MVPRQLMRTSWPHRLLRCVWPIAVGMLALTLAGAPGIALDSLHLVGLVAVLPMALLLVWTQPRGARRWAWTWLALALLGRTAGVACVFGPAGDQCGQRAAFELLTSLLLLAGAALLMCVDRAWVLEGLQHGLDGLLLGFVLGATLLISWHVDMDGSLVFTILVALHVGVAMRFFVNLQLASRIAGAAFLVFSLSELLRIVPLGIDLTFGWLGAAPARAVALAEVSAWALLLTVADRTLPLRQVRDPSEAADDASAWVRGVAFAILVSAAVASVPTVILLGVAVLFVGREIVLDRRRRQSWREINVEFAVDQAEREKQQHALQTRIEGQARLAHDMAGPMQGLWRLYDALKDMLPPLGDQIYGQLHPLQRLNEQMLFAASGQALGLRREGVELRLVIEDALSAGQERAQAQNVSITTVFATATARIVSDATAIRRILDNLLTNALDVLPSGGHILIELSDDPEAAEMLVLSVRDSGPGLTLMQQASMFEPGVRFRQGRGLGLGLANVRKLAEQLGGSCGVQSVPGSGTTIWVRLPEIAPAEGAE